MGLGIFRRTKVDIRRDADEAQRQQQRTRAEAWLRQQKAAAEVQLRREMEARAARRAAEEYQRSPIGQAEAAFERGDQFLQLELSHAQVAGSTGTSSWMRGESSPPQHEAHCDQLGSIEAVGWRLLHANWVYLPTRQRGQHKLPATNSQPAGAGEVVGIYLFRRNDTAANAPVQRRDVTSSTNGVAVERRGSHRSHEFGS